MPKPPENLTEKEKERNGWNDNVTQEELDKLRNIARKTTEDPTSFFNKRKR